MMTRKQFLVGGAGVTAVALVGGGAGVGIWDRATSPESPAAAYSEAMGTDRIALAASLAASSHNTQPWSFRVSPEAIDLLGDIDRTMGNADARKRELHMSLGCALENAVIAAADAGLPVEVEHVRGSAPNHFARLRFTDTASPAASHPELAEAIPKRRTNRGPFDVERAVDSDTLSDLGALAQDGVQVTWITEDSERESFTQLAVEATAAHVADEAIQKDSHMWYRMSRAGAEEHRDGITVASANLSPMISLMLGLFPPTADSFDKGWEKATRETHCGTAPAFGVLTIKTPGDRAAWVEAGRTYQRMQLAATLDGLALHPISQPLTVRDVELESGTPGVFADRLSKLHPEGEIVLTFRVGYPTREQEPSLRRSPKIESVASVDEQQ